MTDSQLFKSFSNEDHAQAIADFLPGGCLYEAKNQNTTVYRMFLRGLGETNRSVEDFLILFDNQIDINTTEAFLDGWEKTVGIPDDCFDTNVPDEVRRQQILIKLAALGVQTEEDFEALALLYGVVVEIASGEEHNVFTMNFPIFLFDSAKTARFTMIVFYQVAEANTFTYTFPIIFGDAAIPILECLFRKLAPGNVDVIFHQVDQVDPKNNRGFSLGFSSGFG